MSSELASFDQLALPAALLQVLREIGYETPTPIQAASIPPLLAGRDLLGQAQTGTGKTAAFALPLLARIDLDLRQPQILVLTPTRELAIQVAEAFQTYARHLPGFHVLPVYGGQGMDTQLRQLRRGVHTVVGTPGRVMDHLRRKTLQLDHLRALILDEGDEMLRMGFLEDVEWILEQTPSGRQIALFSATLPSAIQKVAKRHLHDPAEVRIQSSSSTVEATEQYYWRVDGVHKLDALTRILEVEEMDAALIFVRTKTATVELAEKIEARGYACAALNGDITQVVRERTIDQLKKGRLDIVVATDVAARGLDVSRITHVFNYDIPYDVEAYVHRIGRTGRAGRAGRAILFVAPREMRMLRAIEHAIRRKLEPLTLPSSEAVTNQRIERFKQQVQQVLANEDLDFFDAVVADLQRALETSPERVAAALAWLAQRDRPLRMRDTKPKREPARPAPPAAREIARPAAPPPARQERQQPKERPPKNRKPIPQPERADDGVKWVRYRIEVGSKQGISAGDVVGAIANEAGLDSQYIGAVQLADDYCTVELPDGMPRDLYRHLQKVRLRQHPMHIHVDGVDYVPPHKPPKRKPRGGT